jgi:GT2 family glycosyltransferase
MGNLKKAALDIKFFLFVIRRVFKLVSRSHQSGHLGGILKHLRRTVLDGLTQVLVFAEENKEFGNLESPSLQKLQDRTRGLHSLLPHADKYQYSILIPVYHPHPIFFEKAVKSALSQSAPYCEVLLGLDGPQSQEVMEVIERLKASNQFSARLKVIEVDRSKSGGGISQTTNVLAREAQGNFLLLMDHDDWISPDLLFRYEQCLRLLQDPHNSVLYCNEYKINENDEPILDSHTAKPEHPIFPYLFVNWICHCLLVPKVLWEKIGGLRSECDGAQDYDLCLRLDLADAQFQNVPFCLYAWRAHTGSTAKAAASKNYATPSGLQALKDYAQKKGLRWTISEGNFPTVYRAIPEIKTQHKVHVIIPYKDQKELTLKAVKSVLNQKNVSICITAIDNRSQDTSIADELTEKNIEVLRVDEPFNYSRLNNLAVQNSRWSSSADCLLFLNNDVELSEGAVEELLRWIDQPKVGVVGAQLLYPNKRIQHGGIMLDIKGPMHRMSWGHVDVNMPPENAWSSQILGIRDAVTAACLLMKRETFLKVGGFDAVWYPIAYSDTDLSVKVRRLGLYCFYTPYAWGIHYESATRGPGVYETPEASFWMFKSAHDREIQKKYLKHSVFASDF